MKPSFYIVLWLLAYLPAILLDIPFLNEYGFFFSFIIVCFADCIIRKLLKNQIEYQQMCEVAFVMEMAYNNDYKKYKRQALLQAIVYTAMLVWILLCFITLFTAFSNVSIIDYILYGAFMILAGIGSSTYIRFYLQVRKAGCIILDKELQEIYPDYKDARDTCTYEDMLLPRPQYYKVINTANTIFSILGIVIGLLTITILYAYRGESYSNAELGEIILAISGALTTYRGIKDLLNTLNSQKYLLLLFSCIFVALLYMPFTNYLNKTFLMACIDQFSGVSYDAKSNLVHESIDVEYDLAHFEPTDLKKRNILYLSSEGSKKLLENIIRADAEYQVVYRDNKGKELVITIATSELKEIYHQTKSNLDIYLEIMKLDFGEETTKVYEDGEYIVVELLKSQDVSLTQSLQTEISTLLANFTKSCAEDYDIACFNRGLKVRCIYNNNQFVEHSLSLEEIIGKKEDKGLNELDNDTAQTKSGGTLFNLFE